MVTRPMSGLLPPLHPILLYGNFPRFRIKRKTPRFRMASRRLRTGQVLRL